ncbi:zinc-containing alcohol dehydrogenase superfamily protein, partial [Metarhizium majus ARSEF 297]
MSMKAIVISASGPPETLVVKEVPKPAPTPNTALIRIHAFGINHAEMHMRRGEWAESVPISGIECVGTIEWRLVMELSETYLPMDNYNTHVLEYLEIDM